MFCSLSNADFQLKSACLEAGLKRLLSRDLPNEDARDRRLEARSRGSGMFARLGRCLMPNGGPDGVERARGSPLGCLSTPLASPSSTTVEAGHPAPVRAFVCVI